MRTRSRCFAVVVLIFLAFSALAQVGGKGRLQGSVVDKKTRKPIVGASVMVTGDSRKVVHTKSTEKGQWSAIGFTAGTWSIEIEARGYKKSRGTATIADMQVHPPIRTELEPADPGATIDPSIANVPEDAADAVSEAQELLLIFEGDPITKAGRSAAATAEDVKANNVKAAALLEGALPQILGDGEDRRRMRAEIRHLLAQAHYTAGDIPKATAALEPLVATDASDPADALQLLNLYVEGDKVAEAKALLAKIPAEELADPEVFVNVGILFLNNSSFGDAVSYLDKALELDPNNAPSYYYRGLANVGLKKSAEARADFERVLVLDPDAPEADQARQQLAELK